MNYELDQSWGDFLYQEEMKNFTSFQVGGPADLVIRPKDEKSLIQIIKRCREKNYNYYILGNCSNIIVHDDGFRGVIILLKHRLQDISKQDNFITAGAGASLKAVSEYATEHSLSGLEFAHGIPGTVGGAMVMNAGAYDGEMKMVVSSVRVLTLNNEIVELSNEEMNFRYRNSRVQDEKLVVLSTTFQLQKGNREEIRKKYEDFDKRRQEKQPLDMPSAGSTFKRPTGYFAGKLIDDSGLRGFTHRGAGVSQKHCGFVVNKGNATARDILETIEMIQKVVYDNFGVELEREVKIIGG
ncbi:MAG: UDP-N-acetylmuramate dehydrogenase [Tissierellia bacterium]|nr:UDP-N-acetylmuramate dehydrogenase [Tissierellia bacterium]